MALKLISLNIEMERHLDLVEDFLRAQQADVVCLQELFEADIARMEKATGATCIFVPMAGYDSTRGAEVRGIAILSRVPYISVEAIQYAGNRGPIAQFVEETTQDKHNTQKYLLAVATVEKEDVTYQIGTTHFPWTPDGNADELQRESLAAMLNVLEGVGPLVFCGDFNAPRGKEIFSALAERYTDNVPPEYTTSIDGDLHRAGPLPYMVDGLFSTPEYQVTEVEMVCGVSDHCALMTNIQKNT